MRRRQHPVWPCNNKAEAQTGTFQTFLSSELTCGHVVVFLIFFSLPPTFLKLSS